MLSARGMELLSFSPERTAFIHSSTSYSYPLICSGTSIPVSYTHLGDTVEVTVTFPEDYGVEELNGKEAVFTVTVNGIYE